MAISIDGRGRGLDNVFVERLWRSVKYEREYLHDYDTVQEAVQDSGDYFDYITMSALTSFSIIKPRLIYIS